MGLQMIFDSMNTTKWVDGGHPLKKKWAIFESSARYVG